MDAVILAGGLGTRLRQVVSDLPKPMAPVAGRPFLAYLLDHLARSGIRRAVLSVGHLHEKIGGFFRDSYKGMEIAYSIEEEPLGTGGGIKQALSRVSTPDFLLMNGDTFFDIKLNDMLAQHEHGKNQLTLALKPMENFDRYGNVVVRDGKVVSFEEKKKTARGLIYGGVCAVSAALFGRYDLPRKFSFEKDLLESRAGELDIGAFVSEGYFIDIGIPGDYDRAQAEMRGYL